MRITKLLNIDSINLDGKPKTKTETLDMMVDLMCKGGNIEDKIAYRNGVYIREKEGTTGIGEGIAIPHAKSNAVKKAGLAAMVIKEGVDFETLDGEPVYLVFLIAAPNNEDNVHLDVLSRLSVLLMDEEFTWKLRNANTKEEFLRIIDEAERMRDEEDKTKDDIDGDNNEEINKTSSVTNDESNITNGEVGKNDSNKKYIILAVTGCPTGIAHTYMAAEALQKAAKKKGAQIKVETRGSGGAKNVLTDKEIEEAVCIIVASDTKVPMDRFSGKKVISCQVSDGISKADELVERAINGEAKVFKSDNKELSENSISKEGKGSFAHKIYTHLMNGVSHMLPFVVGGGILIALAFLIDGLLIDVDALTEAERGNFGTITKWAATFKEIGGFAFNFMLPILAGFIALSIADRPGLLVGTVGGYIASVGKSGFLGALVAGFLAGLIILFLRKIFAILPESLEGMKPVLLYPVLGVLLIGLAMRFFIEPPVGALNTTLNNALSSMSGTSKIFLGIVLGGMMSIDFGGPVNKAAYVFGTASIAAGNYDIMAAVMIGGMVPPCAIALATLIFRNKFTVEERKSGPVNFVMGLGFITEGAIPFAAADPLRVIPACTIGSAVAGALSMFFNCTLMAPHGGIFVVPVMGNWLYYLIALVVGTVVGAVLLGVFKKSVEEEYEEI